MTYHYLSKYTVYMRICSWYCTFYGFSQRHNDMYSPLHYQTQQFTTLKISCGPTIYSFFSPNSGLPLIFYSVRSFAFSRMSCSWDHTACRLFSLASFSQYYAFKIPLCLLMSSCCSVAKSSPIFCTPKYCSTPGSSVLYLPEFVQIHVMLSNHFILCHPPLQFPSIFPSIRVFSYCQFFPSGGQIIGVSASASGLSNDIQD